MGVVSLPSDRSARSQTSPGQVSERRTLPLWGLGQGCSQRTQRAFGTAMRLCASLSRGVAAPLGCVIFLQFGDVAVFSLCAQYFLNVRGGGGITTLDVFRTQSKRPVPACPNDSFAVFRGWAAIIDSSAAKYVPFPAGTGLSHPNSPGSLLRKGTGAVFLHHFRERAKNVAICALVQVAFGSNLPPPTPVVMPFSTAHATACA